MSTPSDLPGREGADGDRAHVTKLVGAPGGGKTTTLLDYAEREARAGTAYGELYYLTFTRSGAAEARERLLGVFTDGDEDDIKRRAKTVHGAALSACIVDGLVEDVGEQIIDPGSAPDVYETFCRRRGLSYDDGEGDPLKRAGEGDNVEHGGNKFFAIYNWLKATRKPYSAFEQAPVSLGVGHETGVRLLEKWDEFKETHQDLPLLEHADYVDLAIDHGLAPGVKVMLIDEFQDLSPQQYQLVKDWRDRDLERLYIAGDANQSIYGFRAARPLYFNETDVDDVDWRTKSYRCPDSVATVGRNVLLMCDETDPNGFEARRDGGVAQYRRIEYAPELGDAVREAHDRHVRDADGAAVFLLARTNRQAFAIANALTDEGVRYSMLGAKADPWDDPLPSLYASLRQIRASADPSALPDPVLRRLTDRLPGTKGKSATEMWREIADAPLRETVGKLGLDYYERDRLLNAVASDHHNDPDDVKVGTIHSAKGLEAPAVFLFDAYTSNLAEKYHTGDAAEEHRLYYVGATRASEELQIINGFDALPNRVFPAFEGGLPGAGSPINTAATDGGIGR